jgi:hypothetical protein
MISRMPAPPIVNNLELRDGWSVDISTIHNGRFTETCAFVLKNGKSPNGGHGSDISWVELRWYEGHMEACDAAYRALATLQQDRPLTLTDITNILASTVGR